jgi:hypothetical protein
MRDRTIAAGGLRIVIGAAAACLVVGSAVAQPARDSGRIHADPFVWGAGRFNRIQCAAASDLCGWKRKPDFSIWPTRRRGYGRRHRAD